SSSKSRTMLYNRAASCQTGSSSNRVYLVQPCLNYRLSSLAIFSGRDVRTAARIKLEPALHAWQLHCPILGIECVNRSLLELDCLWEIAGGCIRGSQSVDRIGVIPIGQSARFLGETHRSSSIAQSSIGRRC